MGPWLATHTHECHMLHTHARHHPCTITQQHPWRAGLACVQAAAAEAAAKAAAEEAGDDPEELPPSWLAGAAWRLRAWCLTRWVGPGARG